nr:MAG TPA: hypothetical protein [Caudoviricetes sp.]
MMDSNTKVPINVITITVFLLLVILVPTLF